MAPPPPKRIISLVPSITELLFDLGLNHRIVGVTKFCVHPAEKTKGKVKIGGTKKLDLNKIVSLNPDLILANKEENTKADIEWLADRFPVWVSDVSDFDSSLALINSVGEMTASVEKAKLLADRIQLLFESLELLMPDHKHRVAYLIWENPYMSVGCDTFIHAMLEKAGFENVFAPKTRYPQTNLAQLQELSPEYLFLSSEPFPFTEKKRADLSALLPKSKIILVDGEMFSWYGSRMLKASAYFVNLRKELDLI